MANHAVITGQVDIPNLFFTIEGESFIGNYVVQSNPFRIIGLPPLGGIPIELYFRNTLLFSGENINPTDAELLSKKFQNTKYKIEKIIKFTNSK
tara:strand:- start:33 stop:314 length:282 start_codon:yes stop_codon:yes gene_type:complete